MRTRENYKLNLREVRFDRESLVNILRFGLPAGVQNSVIGIANLVVQTNINSFGAAAMAGCGAHSKMEGFIFLPVTCFSQALSTFVGQNLGAHNYDRVKEGVGFGIISSMVVAELMGVTRQCVQKLRCSLDLRKRKWSVRTNWQRICHELPTE
jgi:Na+-driven multidrug efflux pump